MFRRKLPTMWFTRKMICLLLLSLTVSFIGWRVQAGRWLFSTKALSGMTELHVSTEQELRDALTATSGAQNGDTVVFDANITLSRDLPAVQNSITINGNGYFLDGAGAHRGLFVYAGTVAIQNLAIQNAVAQGGAGAGGGGGAGLGGALFVNTGANVTISGVTFNGNAAKGGSGYRFGISGGGGGGLGGDGRRSGGGIGAEADGGASPAPTPGAGIVTGAASGGGAEVGQNGGANGGGGAASTNANGGGGGGGVNGGSGVGVNGGAGGFGGGAGGSGGAGGFGGGGGGGDSFNSGIGGAGGFGGGGGGGVQGTFGVGGFGAGGGGADGAGYAEIAACSARCGVPPPPGGGGVVANVNLGGGGLGAGGAVFVRDGGTLAISGGLTETGSTVTAGQSYNPPGGGGPPNPCDCLAAAHRKAGSLGFNGSAFGAGMFLQGSGTLSFAPGSGESQSVGSVIADQTGSGGTNGNAGSWALSKSGAGTLSLNAANTYTGGTTINAGTLSLGTANSAGTGALTFAAGQTATLQVNAASVPTNTIKGFAPGHTINLAGAGLATNASLGANNVLTVTGGTISPITLNLDPAQNFSAYVFNLATDNNGGTALNLTAIHTISGQVTAGNIALAGVTLTLSGSSSSATSTNGSGNYSFPNLAAGGNYVVTPMLTGYAFTPASATFNNLSANQTQNFTACATNPVVTNTNDSGAGSLREAITIACPGSTITFANGINLITLTSGQLLINKSLTLRGPGANQLTISGNNATRVFEIDSGVTVNFEDLTIANGKEASSRGGGISSPHSASTVNLTNCTLANNMGTSGGGINSGGKLTITNSTISGNSASINGGGLYNSGGPLTITDCTIANNSAPSGGGLSNFGGPVIITRSIIADNSCTSTNPRGGGIYNIANTGFVISGSTISGNRLSSNGGFPYGGGIYNGSGMMTLINSTMSGNTVSGSGTNAGGGLYNVNRATLINSTISGNTVSGSGSNQGSGLYNFNMATLINSTISGNTVSGGTTNQGGGVFNNNQANVNNTIIAGNTAATGPDVFNLGTPFTSQGHNLIGKSDGSAGFTNGVNGDQVGTIATPLEAMLAPLGNYGGPTQTMLPLAGSPALDMGGPVSEIQEIRVSNSSGNFTLTFNGQMTSSLAFTASPAVVQAALEALPNVGAGNVLVDGPFRFFQVFFRGALAGSNQPQLTAGGDAGASTMTVLDGGNAGSDQRGFTRPQGSARDIGAFEANYSLAATGGTPQSTTVTTAFANPLVATLTESGNPVSNVLLTFTAPGSGASVTFPNGNTATTNANGQVSVNVAANTIPGVPYTVTANTTPGLATPASFNLSNTCPTFTLGTPTATGALGVPYSSSAAATPAVSAPLNYRYSLANGTALPAGLSLNANTGAITGTPTAPGNVSFDLKAELFNDNTATGCAVTSTRSINVTCVTIPVVTSTADSGAGSLREAIAIACPGSTITFANGVSLITLTSGELVINKNLTIQGPGANVLTISGNNASRVFNINSGVTATIDALTIANGRVSFGSNNFGGGIYNDGTVTLTNSTLSGNGVQSGPGSNNQGGGIYNTNNGTVSLTHSTLSGNSAGGSSSTQRGGGIANYGTLTVTNSTLFGNFLSGGFSSNYGCGIYNDGTVTLTNSTLSGNYTSASQDADNQGGGIYNNNNGTVMLTNSTLSSNSASGGTINNTGGGIANFGTVKPRNTIIAGNSVSGGTSQGPDVLGAFNSQGNNLIGKSDNSTGFTDGVNGDQIGTIATPKDAMLGPLGNYGGPTQTHRLLPGSPAINAGNNCVLTANGCGNNNPALATDQRGTGFQRQVGSAVDIGAFEANYALAVTGGNNQSTTVNTAFANPLVATLTESGQPVSGVQITFTAPGSGASATLTGNPATTNASGQASVMATANSVTGMYQVQATASGLTPVNFSLTNTCPTIVVMNLATATGTAGTMFSQTFTQSGGVGSVAFTTTSTLPNGLMLASNGTLSGTPTQTGTFLIVVKATDSNGCMGTGMTYTLVISCPTAATLPTTLPGGTGGTSYSASVAASPSGTYTYGVSLGSLPNGLSLNETTGALTGTPTMASTFNFTITATRFGSCAVSQAYTVTIACPRTINLLPQQPQIATSTGTFTSLPAATVGVNYTTTVSATPANGAYAFTLTPSPNNLPNGLTLNPNTGAITGTATVAGTYKFRIQATGFGVCSGSRLYLLQVNEATKLAAKANQVDFDGDGKSDLWSYRSEDGLWYIQRSSDGKLAFAQLGSLNEIAVPADYDGDGKTDVAVFNTLKRRWQIVQSSNGALREAFSGSENAQAYPADYDGDGKADLAVRTVSGEWEILPSNSRKTRRFTLGVEGDQTALGDFNGDGRTDLVAYRPHTGQWMIRDSQSGEVTERYVAFEIVPKANVVAADFDGDGLADLAWWSAEAKQLQFASSRDRQTIQSVPLAALNQLVLGDYDGDGLIDLLIEAPARNSAPRWQTRLGARTWQP